MAAVLVPPPRAAPLTRLEEARVARLLEASSRLLPVVGALPPERMREANRRVYRRFVLEALLALRAAEGGALRANALARATGLSAQPFANKARELVAMGAAERSEAPGAGRPAVTYALTPRGWRLGTLAFGLTAYKALQCRIALERPGAPPPAEVAFDRLAPPSPEEVAALWTTLDAEGDALAREFLAARPGPRHAGAAEVRRYAETCVRKWHGEVLVSLVQGPLRFAELRGATGAGDEALTRALRSLTALGAVARGGEGYAITPWGRGDLALGSALTLAAAEEPTP